MIAWLKWWYGQLCGLKGAARPCVRSTTKGSEKWNSGHKTGCVFHAPESRCICIEFIRLP